MQIQGMMGGMDMNAMREKRAAMFAKADGDKSGGLSLEEFTKAAQSVSTSKTGKTSGSPEIGKMFAKMDADGDGNVTAAEMEKMKPPQQMMGGDTMNALLSAQGLGQSGDAKSATKFDPDKAMSDLLAKALDAFNASNKQDETKSSKPETGNTKSTNVDQTMKDLMTKALEAFKASNQQAEEAKTSTVALAA
jgi:EF hand